MTCWVAPRIRRRADDSIRRPLGQPLHMGLRRQVGVSGDVPSFNRWSDANCLLGQRILEAGAMAQVLNRGRSRYDVGRPRRFDDASYFPCPTAGGAATICWGNDFNSLWREMSGRSTKGVAATACWGIGTATRRAEFRSWTTGAASTACDGSNDSACGECSVLERQDPPMLRSCQWETAQK